MSNKWRTCRITDMKDYEFSCNGKNVICNFYSCICERMSKIEEKKQAAADVLFNYSKFALVCIGNQVRPCDLRLHLMKEISGIPTSLKRASSSHVVASTEVMGESSSSGKMVVVEPTNSDSDGVLADLRTIDYSVSDEAALDNITSALLALQRLELLQDHYDLLQASPFYLLFRAVRDPKCASWLSWLENTDDAVYSVVDMYDQASGHFHLGGKVMKPTKRDVELTFGFLNGKEPLPIENQPAGTMRAQWLLRCFRDASIANWKLTKSVLFGKLRELCSTDRFHNVEDVVRLLHCYLAACVFCPQNNSDYVLVFANLAEDISTLKNFDWAGYILKVCFGKPSCCEIVKTVGCSILLLVWLCEHVALIQPRLSHRMQFPRMLRWDLQELYDYVGNYGLHDISSEMVNVQKLLLRNSEVKFFKNQLREMDTLGTIQSHALDMVHVPDDGGSGNPGIVQGRANHRRSMTQVVSSGSVAEDSDGSSDGRCNFVYLGERVSGGMMNSPVELVSDSSSEEYYELASRSPVPTDAYQGISATEQSNRLLMLETDNARLQLSVQAKNAQNEAIRAAALSECMKHRDYMVGMKLLASQMREGVAEVKEGTQAILTELSNECLKLASECQRLGGINVNLQSKNEMLSITVGELTTEQAHLKRKLMLLQGCLSSVAGLTNKSLDSIQVQLDDFGQRDATLNGSYQTLRDEEKSLLRKKEQHFLDLQESVQERDNIIGMLFAKLRDVGKLNENIVSDVELPGTDEEGNIVPSGSMQLVPYLPPPTSNQVDIPSTEEPCCSQVGTKRARPYQVTHTKLLSIKELKRFRKSITE